MTRCRWSGTLEFSVWALLEAISSGGWTRLTIRQLGTDRVVSVYETGGARVVLQIDFTGNIVEGNIHDVCLGPASFTASGPPEASGKIIGLIKDILRESVRHDKHFIDWAYLQKGEVVIVPLLMKRAKPVSQEHYPFIPNLHGWIDDFFASTAPIVILNGPPGTGKTNLITHMIERNHREVITTHDSELMRMDSLYASFLRGGRDMLVVEDADLLLLSRQASENTTMSKLLNVSEGVVDVGTKKIVFTANIDNAAKIDQAIMRPGRCYDLIDFRPLDPAEILALGVGGMWPCGATLAQLFKNGPQNRGLRTGFV